MHTKTLAELSHMLASKACSSREMTEHYLARIKQFDALNAFVSVTEDIALTQADVADALIAKGSANPMTGIPFAHKDIFCTQGVKTSCGSKMLDNFISPYDATVTHQMQQAGMVMLGKTNMDEFAMGSSNENSYYGPVQNPWDIKTVPGGSSGGSASAVAARLAPAATGTDTGGSIRQPASLCGISGLKPTYGRVSRYGMIAFASSLDQGGPMAQTAEDLAMILQVMAGHDAKDSTSINKEVPNYCASLNDSMSGLRIGVPKNFFDTHLDDAIAQVVKNALAEFEKMGATLVDVELSDVDAAIAAYYVIAPAECSSNLSRFDGVRFGYRCSDPKDLTDLYERSRGEAFGAEVKRRIMMGTYALSSGYYDAYYLKAQRVRRAVKADFMKAFVDVDLIMGPVTPSVAFPIGERCDDPIAMYLSDTYTIGVNLAGLPGMSIPAGFVNNLPVGLQIIGNYFDEPRMLNAAHQFQQHTDWHKQLPNTI